MKRQILLLTTAFLLVALGFPSVGHPQTAADRGRVFSLPKEVFLMDPEAGWVIADGRWKRIEGSMSLPSIPEINSVHIDCRKSTKTCYEAIAGLLSIGSDNSNLKSSLFKYNVTSWTENHIRGTA